MAQRRFNKSFPLYKTYSNRLYPRFYFLHRCPQTQRKSENKRKKKPQRAKERKGLTTPHKMEKLRMESVMELGRTMVSVLPFGLTDSIVSGRELEQLVGTWLVIQGFWDWIRIWSVIISFIPLHSLPEIYEKCVIAFNWRVRGGYGWWPVHSVIVINGCTVLNH